MSETVDAGTYWDAVAQRWRRLRPQRLWRMHSDAVNARLLAAWLPPSSRGRLLKTDAFDEAVSDGLGCALAARCDQLVAMDLAAATLRAARPRLGDRLTSADARALPFAAGSFDAVVSLSTLDHFASESELLASLSELRRVCRPGARLVLTLDNPANPLIRLRGLLPFSWLHAIGLVPYFVGANLRPDRLCAALRASGFEVEAKGAAIHAPRVLAIAVGRWIERSGSARLERWWLRLLMRFEGLASRRTRFLTGHFVAIGARARGGEPPSR